MEEEIIGNRWKELDYGINILLSMVIPAVDNDHKGKEIQYFI